jgi:hypothetical protein
VSRKSASEVKSSLFANCFVLQELWSGDAWSRRIVLPDGHANAPCSKWMVIGFDLSHSSVTSSSAVVRNIRERREAYRPRMPQLSDAARAARKRSPGRMPNRLTRKQSPSLSYISRCQEGRGIVHEEHCNRRRVVGRAAQVPWGRGYGRTRRWRGLMRWSSKPQVVTNAIDG